MSDDQKTDPKTQLKSKLQSETMTGLWLDLKDHAERNAVFLVSQDLDLVEVGIKIVNDDTSAVGPWIQEGQLARPTPQQMNSWAGESGKMFRFLIVAPHVLIQEQSH